MPRLVQNCTASERVLDVDAVGPPWLLTSTGVFSPCGAVRNKNAASSTSPTKRSAGPILGWTRISGRTRSLIYRSMRCSALPMANGMCMSRHNDVTALELVVFAISLFALHDRGAAGS